MLPEAKPARRSMRILLVEDDVMLRFLVADELRHTGFVVVEAKSADAALSYLDSGGGADLVFSDIQMPGSIDGLELARRVRARWPAVPVILTSADRQPAGAGDMGEFVPKPYDLGKVVAAVRRILGPQRCDEG